MIVVRDEFGTLDRQTVLRVLHKGLHAEDSTGLVYDEERFRADAAVLDGVRLAGRGSLASRLWTQPALSVTGMDVTPVDVAANTILIATVMAVATVSLWLVILDQLAPHWAG